MLDDLIERGNRLLGTRPLRADDHGSWELLARNFLEKTFGTNSPNVASVTDVGKYGGFPLRAGEEFWEKHRAESLSTQLKRLDSLRELLRTEVQLTHGTSPHVAEAPRGHKIFLVHGHDEGALQGTARYLEKLQVEFIVLREQPNKGRTVIEKFEDYSDVGFAVVLLTPDDIGGKAGAEEARPRARQNVVLELGYFLGRLGRQRVCALYRDGVEIPSDYSGVLFVQLDDRGAWRLELAKELKAAGFPIDMNNAL